MIEIKVSYDRDRAFAHDACRWWAALALTAEQKSGVEDPIEMERLADENADRAHTRFIVSDDPDEVVERIAPYVELGFADARVPRARRRPGALPRPVLRRRAPAPARALGLSRPP